MSISYRVYLKLNRILLPVIFKILKKLNWNKLTCDILVLTIRINSNLWKKSNGLGNTKKNNFKTILCFNRAIFDKDLIEIEKRTNLNILVFDNEHYTIFADTYLSKNLRDQMTYFETPDTSKEIFFNLIDQMIFRLQAKLGFDFLLNSNIIYYQDHEWSKVCKKRKIPFITLCKEVPATKKNEKIWIRDWSGFPYYGDRIAVYSHWTKDILLNKCKIGSEKMYKVTGCPRTDPIYDIYFNKKNSLDKNYIVLFDFLEYQKPTLWQNTISKFVESAHYSFINKYDYKFIIKTKYHTYNPIVQKYLDKLDIPLNNIQITHDLDIKEIAKYSKLICGFRTTSIIKLMISNIDIIIVDWAESLEEPEDRLITDQFRESCFVANSKEIYKKILHDRLFNKNIMNPKRTILRDQLIEKNLYKIDGKRSIGFEKFVYSSI